MRSPSTSRAIARESRPIRWSLSSDAVPSSPSLNAFMTAMSTSAVG